MCRTLLAHTRAHTHTRTPARALWVPALGDHGTAARAWPSQNLGSVCSPAAVNRTPQQRLLITRVSLLAICVRSPSLLTLGPATGPCLAPAMACPGAAGTAPPPEEDRRVRPRTEEPDVVATYLLMHGGSTSTLSRRLHGLDRVVLSTVDRKTLCMDARDDMKVITPQIGGWPSRTGYFEAKCARAVCCLFWRPSPIYFSTSFTFTADRQFSDACALRRRSSYFIPWNSTMAFVRMSAWNITKGDFIDASPDAPLTVHISALLDMPDEWADERQAPSELFGKWTFLVWPNAILRFWEQWDPLDHIGLLCVAEDISMVRSRPPAEAHSAWSFYNP